MTLPRSSVFLGALGATLCGGLAHGQVFTDQTQQYFSGNPSVPTNHASFGDFDNDGWVDLLAGGKVFQNQSGMSFRELLAPLLFEKSIWGDFDNDGLLDIFSIPKLRLYRNDGSYLFLSDTTVPEWPMTVSRGAAWADLDNDGFLDLYVGGYESPGYEPDVILRGWGPQNLFTTWWTQSGDIDPARGITAADFDNDGDQDVYVSNYRLEANLLFVNDGQAGFSEEAAARGVAGDYDGYTTSYGHSIGSVWGDLDDDGNLDLFVGNLSHSWGLPDQDRSKFYRNRGAPFFTFQDMFMTALLCWQESYATPALADYDNDGDLDLFLTTVYSGDNPVLYRNDGAWVFTDVTAASLMANMGPTYQAAWADVDNDGDCDLMAGDRLFMNQGTPNHWIKVRLDGTGASFNRAAIGAQVRAFSGGRTLTRQVEGGTGEGNQNDLTLHIGMGGYTGPVPLTITWPDGSQQGEIVAVDQLTVIGPGGIVGSPWTDLGGGTVGSAGPPTLVGSGALVGGTFANLTLTDAPASAPVLAWYSLAPTSFPAVGGTVHAFPPANQFLFFADATGVFNGSATWPTGIPPGTNVWFQFVVQDASVIHGITLSNGLLVTTP